MADQIQNIKDITTIALPLIKPIIDIWVKPKLDDLYKSSKLEKQLIQYSIDDKFEEYLNRSYQKNSIINTIVFQNQQKKLEDIYIPLTIQSDQSDRKKVTFNIDEYSDDFVPKYNKVLITDTAGMGKSTILKWLFLSCIKKNKGIPIFIELRKLSSSRGVLDEIFKEINPIDSQFDKDLVLKLINKGDFIFFFDGYDEIPFKERESVTRDLQDFVSKTTNNLFIMTSRPESALASFGDFQQFNIRPLEIDEAFNLLRKYDNCGDLSEGLIQSIKDDSKLKNLEEFLTNPMLVSLLYKAYDYKPTIPYKKHIFYRQVYDSLFEKHDLTKGGSYIHEKYSQLDIEDFHRVLRTLGFITLKLGKIEFGKDELLNLLQQSKENCPGIEFKINSFLQDLIISVPLFNQEGEYYRWSHKSIQEYFAAQFICIDAKGDQEKILYKMYHSDENSKYYNVFDLCYDIDYKSFRKTIIYDLVNKFINYSRTAYSKIESENISNNEIQNRKALTFCKRIFFIKSNFNSKGKEKAFIEQLRNIWGESDSIWIMTKSNKNMLFIRNDFPFTIIKLLVKKKDSLIDTLNYKKCNFHINIEENKSFELTDEPDLIFNNSDFFCHINKMICIAADFCGVLNLEKCKTLQNEVLNEIANEQACTLAYDL